MDRAREDAQTTPSGVTPPDGGGTPLHDGMRESAKASADSRPGPMSAEEFEQALKARHPGSGRFEISRGHVVEAGGGVAGVAAHMDLQSGGARSSVTVTQAPNDHPEGARPPASVQVDCVDFRRPANPTLDAGPDTGGLDHPVVDVPVQQPGAQQPQGVRNVPDGPPVRLAPGDIGGVAGNGQGPIPPSVQGRNSLQGVRGGSVQVDYVGRAPGEQP